MVEDKNWQFAIADHLGNTMVTFEDKGNNGRLTTEAQTDDPEELEVIQRNVYYPFGMNMEGGWNQVTTPGMAYQYNGKERDIDFGLDWDYYNFRMYNSTIGRFISTDPIADQFAHVSPFNYAENEPIGHIDLWGLQKYKLDNGDHLVGPYSHEFRDNENEEIEIHSKLRSTTVTNYDGIYNPRLTEGLLATADLLQYGYNIGFLATMNPATRSIGASKFSKKFAGLTALGSKEIVRSGRMFSHFTNQAGIAGITGIDDATLAAMKPGESILVNTLKFGKGKNSFMAGKEGDIFVTELRSGTSSRKLNQIGVFREKQAFSIQFSEEAAFMQGVRVSGQNVERSIYTIPGNSTLEGVFKIIRNK